MAKLTDQLRKAIDDNPAGMTRYAVCRAIGLDQSTLSRFMAGKAGLALETVDKLGELLELKLVTTKKPGKGKGR
jgi:plasmid maintenance system antidote protein VapI